MWVNDELFEMLVYIFVLPFYNVVSVYLVRKVLERINISKHIIIYDSRYFCILVQLRSSDFFF